MSNGFGCGCNTGCGTSGHHNGFALLVVLFILLVIIGASWFN